MLVEIELQMRVAPTVDHPKPGREAGRKGIPVASGPSVDGARDHPRRSVGDRGGGLGDQRVEARLRVRLAIDVEILAPYDATILSKDPQHDELPLEDAT